MQIPPVYVSILIGLLALPTAPAVVLMQLETFDAPTAWAAGNPHPNPPSIQPDSGPEGTGDPALSINARSGSGPGSRLAAFNVTDWTGDYLSAGIDALTMDLRNQSLLSSEMRVAVNGPGGWFVTDSETLGTFSTWTSVKFDLSPDSLLTAGGSNASSTLAAVTELRILHSTVPTFQGGAGQRTVLVDNIQAVPEPESMILAGLAALSLFRRKRSVAPRRQI